MIEAITKERWQEAQIAEANWLANSGETVETYRRSYTTYFRCLGMSFDQKGKTIVEIGCSRFPALSYCRNLKKAIIIEPLQSANLEQTLSAMEAMGCEVVWMARPLEAIHDTIVADEVILLNVMQHIIDPELFVEKCKQIAPVIRFFEPIDFGISDCHPHTYSIDDFIRWFGHAERYKGGSDEGFHTADCAYGTWRIDA